MSAVMVFEEQEFFAPTNTDAIDMLIGQYRKERHNIEAVAAFMVGEEMRDATRYFFEGNRERFDRYIPDVDSVFSMETALPALNSRFWSRALSLTDVYDYMPNKRREEWNKSIREQKTPDFEEETVRATLGALLAQRMDFLAEMVDGIFHGLSHEHVTNQPEGFRKRMILGWVVDSCGYASTRNAGLIHDLRSVVAKFMGRDQPYHSATMDAVRHCRRNHGEWVTWDGGALRVRVYLKGTAHIEIHPEMAWRLNRILAHKYPMAIPSQHREPPKREAKAREVTLMQRPIPFAALEIIARAEFHKKGDVYLRGERGKPDRLYQQNTLSLGYYEWDKADKHVKREVWKVLEAIGGAKEDERTFLFDYDAKDVISEIVASGAIPDQKSHQFYPTPEKLARLAVEMAGIEPHHLCLEPSAGQGAIAEFMPKDRTLCVEVSPLNCAVLVAKGCDVWVGDFLKLANTLPEPIDRVVMNPPFSEGRAVAHVQAAASLLGPGGRLVAILPASYRGKAILPGFALKWSEVYENEFTGTSVAVTILTAEKAA